MEKTLINISMIDDALTWQCASLSPAHFLNWKGNVEEMTSAALTSFSNPEMGGGRNRGGKWEERGGWYIAEW